MKAKYILTIILCTVGGGISALMGGPQAIVRGAVLGGMLATSVLLAFAVQSYSKNKIIRAVTIPSIGLFLGALTGAICLKLTSFSQATSFLQTPDSLLIKTSALYGLLVTCAMALTRNKAYLSQYFAVWGAFYLVSLLRMLPEILLGGKQIFFIFTGNIPNSFVITSLWFVLFKIFVPHVPTKKKSKNIQIIQNIIAAILIISAIITFFICLPKLALNYRDMQLKAMNNNKAIIPQLNGSIYTTYGNLSSSTGYSSKLVKTFKFSRFHIPYFDIRAGYAATAIDHYQNSGVIVYKRSNREEILKVKGLWDTFAISPRGKYLAMTKDTNLEIISLPKGKKVLIKNLPQTISGICWAPNDNTVILSYSGKLFSVNIKDSKTLELGKGMQPKLAIESKQIFYLKDNKLFCMPELVYSKSKLKIKDCSFLKNSFNPKQIFNVSPNGKFIVYNVKSTNILFESKGFIIVCPIQDNQRGLWLNVCSYRELFFPWLPSENKNKPIK